MEDMAPSASTEEDLPGFVRWKKKYSTVPTTTPLRQRYNFSLIFVALILIGRISVVEGCLPSWFRDDRSDAQALENNQIDENEISDPPELLPASHSSVKQHKQHIHSGAKQHSHEVHHPLHPHEKNELENVLEEEDESIEELDTLYGTAAPIKVNHRLEEARKRYAKLKCKGWCYRGGNCSVDIDEVTYKVRSVNCHCPHGYWGSRCELHFVARLFAPVKGHVEVENTGVSAFAFIILTVIVSIGLIFYTYRKIARRNTPFKSVASVSASHSIRRRPTISFQAMPTSVNTTPSNCTASTNRSTLQNYSCRIPFSPLSRSYCHLSANTRYPGGDPIPSLGSALSKLSLSSTRLQQNFEVPVLKSVTRTGSFPLNDPATPARSAIRTETACYSAFPSRVPIDRPITVDEYARQPNNNGCHS